MYHGNSLGSTAPIFVELGSDIYTNLNINNLEEFILARFEITGMDNITTDDSEYKNYSFSNLTFSRTLKTYNKTVPPFEYQFSWFVIGW